MKTLKVNLFCNQSDASSSGKNIPEPSNRMKRNAAKLQNFCMVFVSHVDAETLNVSHLDPVTVRITGLAIEGKSYLPPQPPHPCFIVQVEECVPKNCAYFYTTGAKRHLLPPGVPDHLKVPLLTSARVELIPLMQVLPAASIRLKPNFPCGIGHGQLTCEGYLLSRMMVSEEDNPTLGNSFLLIKGSKVFVNDDNSFTVTSIEKTTENGHNIIAGGPHKTYVYNNGVYTPSELLCDRKLVTGDPEACISNDDEDTPIMTATNRPRYYAARGFTKLVLLESDIRFNEDCNQKDFFFHDPPQLPALIKKISNSMKLVQKVGVGRCLSASNCILLHGPARVGKKTLVEQASGRLNLPLITRAPVHNKDDLADLFEKARARAPCVVLLTMVDMILTERLDGRPNPLVPALLDHLHKLKSRKCPVVTVLTCIRFEGVAAAVRSIAGGHLLYLPLPTTQHREELARSALRHVLDQSPHVLARTHGTQQQAVVTDSDERVAQEGSDSADLSSSSSEGIAAFAQSTEGFTSGEILHEVRAQICQTTMDAGPGIIYEQLVNVTPLAYRLRNRTFVTSTPWDNIKGYTGLKQMLQRQVSLYREDPARHPLHGLLLYGPPGCSKTMFVKALVSETGFSFFPLMCSVVLSKYVGETEKNLRSLIQQARAAAPSIVFIDEVDGLCGERGTRGSGGGALVAELLYLMGSCVEEGTGCTSVLFVGATNRPQDVDEGLLQARYLSRVVHVGLPDCESRCAMWRHRLASGPCEGGIDERLLCRATQGFSGAEIVGVYQDAGYKLLRDVQAAMPGASSAELEEHLIITQDHLLDAVARNNPRTPQHLLSEIDQFTQQRKNSQLVT